MEFSTQRPPACDTANFRAPSGGTTDSAALTHRQEKQPEDLLEPAASLEVSALNLAALPGQSVESLNLNSLEAPSGAAAPKAPPATTFPLEIPFHTDSYGEGQSEARDLGSLLSMMPPGFGNSGQERRLRRAGANVVNGQAERARLAAAAAAVQHNTRAARNGREQQRAQKISDMIEKLKTLLDKAEFSSSDTSSKLHVLTNCETYLRRLITRTRCYDLEAQLRSIARGSNQQLDVAETNDPNAAVGTSDENHMNEKNERENSGGGMNVDSSDPDKTSTELQSSAGSSSRGSSSSLCSRGHPSADTADSNDFDGASANECKRESSGPVAGGPRAVDKSGGRSSFFAQSERSAAVAAGASPAAVATASESGCGSGSSGEDDGDSGSIDDGGGATDGTSVGTTDSASFGSTTDTASRGFTTDSGYGDTPFGCDSGSADSGDTASGGDGGSADGGSDGSSEEGEGSRMRVVNYFDIFRLSNVPMAIASKDGALVDVNDAMRGFGRIDDSIVKTLTVKSLVSAESAQALDDAMRSMLASPPVASQQSNGSSNNSNSSSAPSIESSQTASSQPFLANAGIGDRPTLLTVSLVYDGQGEASAFHVALIPRGRPDSASLVPVSGNSSNSHEHRGGGRSAEGSEGGGRTEERGAESWEGLGRRNVRFWEAVGGAGGEAGHPAAKRQARDRRD